MIAERNQQLPVLARVGVGNGRDIGRRHRMARIGEQRAVQRALDRAGFRRRDQFRPRQIDFEKIVGHQSARRLRRGRADGGRRKSRNRSLRSLSVKFFRSHADEIDLVARLFFLLALDFEKRKGARRSSRPRAAARCGTVRARRRPRRCDAPRSAYPSAACTTTRRRRLLLPPRAAAVCRSGAPKRSTSCCASNSTTLARSASLASTICTSVDQPSDSDAEKAAAKRRAAFAFEL